MWAGVMEATATTFVRNAFKNWLINLSDIFAENSKYS